MNKNDINNAEKLSAVIAQLVASYVSMTRDTKISEYNADGIHKAVSRFAAQIAPQEEDK